MLLYANSELVYFRVGLAGFKLWQLQIVAILAILRSCFGCALLHCALCIAIIKILSGLRRKIGIVFLVSPWTPFFLRCRSSKSYLHLKIKSDAHIDRTLTRFSPCSSVPPCLRGSVFDFLSLCLLRSSVLKVFAFGCGDVALRWKHQHHSQERVKPTALPNVNTH